MAKYISNKDYESLIGLLTTSISFMLDNILKKTVIFSDKEINDIFIKISHIIGRKKALSLKYELSTSVNEFTDISELSINLLSAYKCNRENISFIIDYEKKSSYGIKEYGNSIFYTDPLNSEDNVDNVDNVVYININELRLLLKTGLSCKNNRK